MITKRFALLMMILILALAPTVAPAQQTFTEDFSTTTYMDAFNTTADWNTTDGELKLFPFVITLAGSYDTAGEAWDMVLSGNHAFVADYSSGLQIVDISDLANPVLAGNYDTSGQVRGLAVSGDHAFLADGSPGLLVVDISDPTNPTLAGSYNTADNAFDVVVSGDHAFVADRLSGLQIIDISDPTTPSLIGSYDTSGSAYGVAVSGDLAFVADMSSGLQVIDVSDPTTPVLAGSYTTPSLARDVEVSGNYAYVADGASGLQVVDISDPANPVLAGSGDTPDNAQDLVISGDRAFVADGDTGLLIFDITDPTSPSLATEYDTSGSASGVAVAGNHAFVADGNTGLQVIRISQPTSPMLAGSYETPDLALGVAVSGDHAFVADQISGLQVIDISNPTIPTITGSYDTPGYAHSVAVSGDHAFVADNNSVQVIDISDPTIPVLAGSYDTPSTVRGVAVAGDHAFVTSYYSGLQVIDISDPTNPTLSGSYATSSFARNLAVSGNHAFVGDAYSGLQVINISDPTNPTLAGSYDTPSDARGVAVAGDYAFVTDIDSGLLVIDISDPTNPVLAGSYDTPGSSAYGVTVSGDHAFVVDFISGLQVIDISDPANPTLAGTLDMSDGARSVAVSGDHAFVAGYNFGLQVIQVRQSEVDQSQNIGQSLAMDGTSDAIIRARLTSTETGGLGWDLSADAGTDWTAVTSDGSWTRVAPTGTDLHWRSTHTFAGPGINPTVSELTIDWLNEFGPINSVTDVPDDQGGWVRIDFTRSGYDFADEASLPVVGYNIYRRVDGAALTTLIGDAESLEADTGSMHTAGKSLPYPLPGMKITRLGDRIFVNASGATTDRAGTFPPGTWEIMTYVAATQSDTYQVSVPTLAGTTTYLVTTHTTTPSEWFVSPTASGASVDNIAPAVPMNLLFSGPDVLSWDEAPEPDFGYHTVYGSENPVFDPSATLIGYTIAQTYDVSGSVASYYHLTTSDHSDNESGAASIIAGPSSTVATTLSCLPSSGTLPFTTTISAELINLYTGQTRRLAARFDVTLAGGGFFGNWRAGYTNVAAGSSYSTSWNQAIPALGALVGSNLFTLRATDVTPAPYNQPPYPAAGDTDTAQCTVVGNAP